MSKYPERVTVHIENVQLEGITAALLAIERADRDWFDEGTHAEVTEIVLGLRAASEAASDIRAKYSPELPQRPLREDGDRCTVCGEPLIEERPGDIWSSSHSAGCPSGLYATQQTAIGAA